MTNTLRCPDVRSRLSGYHDDALPGALKANLHEHLEACDGCRAELASLSRVARLVAAAAVDAPSGFEERLAARLAATRRGRRRWAARGRLAKQMSVFTAAALLAAIIGLGPALLRDFRGADIRTTDEKILDMALFGPGLDEQEGDL